MLCREKHNFKELNIFKIILISVKEPSISLTCEQNEKKCKRIKVKHCIMDEIMATVTQVFTCK